MTATVKLTLPFSDLRPAFGIASIAATARSSRFISDLPKINPCQPIMTVTEKLTSPFSDLRPASGIYSVRETALLQYHLVCRMMF
jgi:hypothetical protein